MPGLPNYIAGASGFPTSFKDFIKETFDHFRNLGICAAIYVVGISLLHHPEWAGPLSSNEHTRSLVMLIAQLDIALAIILLAVNSLKFIWTVFLSWSRVYIKYSQFVAPSLSAKIFYVLKAHVILSIVYMFYFSVVLSIVFIGAHLQLSRIHES